MKKMTKVTRGMFVIFFVLSFLSLVMLPLVCLTEEIFSTDADHSSCVDQPNQTNHSSLPVNNKLPCPSNHSCCNFITSNAADYFFALDSSQITPGETSFHPLEIIASVFRPPKTQA
jgi:hypothetical protein